MIKPSLFKPAWWLKNRHLQTIWGATFRVLPKLPVVERIRLELVDRDFIDVDICGPKSDCVVMLLHGLEGSIDSHYIRGMVAKLVKQQKQVLVMHFRGCSGQQNRLLRSYHSGVSDDLQQVILLLKLKGIVIDQLVGFSLGGNVLLKWLGENHPGHQIKAAVAVCVPLLLDQCADAIDQGFARHYSERLLKTLKQKTHQKAHQYSDSLKLSKQEIQAINSFWEFDHRVTAPINGYKSAADYYQRVSSRQFLKTINIPTLVIHAEDDPFMNSNVIPLTDELSHYVEFELSANGGHVGFVEGAFPWSADYYLERRISEFLSESKSIS